MTGVPSVVASVGREAVAPTRQPAAHVADVRSTQAGPTSDLLALQTLAGNRAVAQLVPTLGVQRFFGGVIRGSMLDTLDKKGRTREATAVRNLLAYAALHGDKGPHEDDVGFDTRLRRATSNLLMQMQAAPSFEKLPARLKAIVYAAEKLNLTKVRTGAIDPANQQWMTSSGGATGARNPGVAGSTGGFGEAAWKCNKLVADSYLAKSGGGIGKSRYPFYGKDQTWSYKASDLAATVHKGKLQLKEGKELKHFPHSELVHLAADGKSIVEIDEFDRKGRHVAKYKLNGSVFEKHVPDGKGGWMSAKVTKSVAELEPGKMAALGDLVSFHSAKPGVSGHTGLNLGEDLFISAMNATEGVGVLSIKRHLDPSAWDHYDYVGFRQFKE